MTCLDRRSWKRFGSAFGTSGLNPSLMTSDLPTSTPETSRTNFFPAVVTDTPSHCLPEELQSQRTESGVDELDWPAQSPGVMWSCCFPALQWPGKRSSWTS
ncbi:uncharacterized protein LOC105353978 isoform X2 [Oryzias latipes]